MSINFQVDSTRDATSYSRTAATDTSQQGDGTFAATLLSTSSLIASPEEERNFATNLTKRLQAAGIDTSKSIALTTDSTGAVIAKDGTADKDKIDALFAADPALANEYRKVASTETLRALGTVYQPYARDYQAAGNDATRAAVWQRYQGPFHAVEAAGNELTLSDGTLTSRAVEVAQAAVSTMSAAQGLPAGLVAQVERSNQDSLMDAVGGDTD